MIDNDAYPQLMATMKARYSCRNYRQGAAPSRAELRAIIEAARIAPSACNRQPWQFLVADTEPLRGEIASCYGREWAAGVGAFIVCLGDHSQAWHRADGKDHTDVDLSIAAEHICLSATTLGLGSCWICNFDAGRLRRVLNLPDELEPVAIIAVGYPAEGETVPLKKRKPIEEIVRWEKF